MNQTYEFHEPVMLLPLVDGLNISQGDYVIDATFGGGGHTKLILERVGVQGRVLGIDRDKDAIKRGEYVFKEALSTGNLSLHLGEFSRVLSIAKKHFPDLQPDAICADLGVSSYQLDTAERGFSLTKEGPLDMRMNHENPLNAAALLNTSPEETLAEIFQLYGEEPKARKLAHAIVTRRQSEPFSTTQDFAAFCKKILAYHDSRIHPATRVFQALRIAVNAELRELESFLEESMGLLETQGRLGVISFHSLEDRIIKNTFKKWMKGESEDPILKRLPIAEKKSGSFLNRGKIIKPFPIFPSEKELNHNQRSRSAKLRIFEKN